MKRNTLLVALILLFVAVAALGQNQSVKANVFFVTPDWVTINAKHDNVRILDVRQDKALYEAGHIPGAYFLPETSFRNFNGTSYEYKSPDAITAMLRAAGINNSDRVVVYSDGKNIIGSTLVAYALERIGFRNIFILDGGYTAYKATQQDVTTAAARTEAGILMPFDNKAIRLDLNQVREALKRPEIKFVDARPESGFNGQTGEFARKGHIPNAINIPWESLVDPNDNYKLRPLRDIAMMLEDKGVKYDSDIVLYCGTGREATMNYVVLKHMLYFPNVRLYEGSWAEYSSVASLPAQGSSVR